VSAIEVSPLVEDHATEPKRRRAKRADAKLRRSLAGLRRTIQDKVTLLAGLESAPEAERMRVAADVFDDWMQVMGAAALRAQALVRQTQDPELRNEAAELFDLVDGSIERYRRLLLALQR
jgi:signal transduction histidine kinase